MVISNCHLTEVDTIITPISQMRTLSLGDVKLLAKVRELSVRPVLLVGTPSFIHPSIPPSPM